MERLAKDINTSDTPSKFSHYHTFASTTVSTTFLPRGAEGTLTIFSCAPEVVRTSDLWISSLTLNQLSHPVTPGIMHSLHIMTNMVWHWTLHTHTAGHVSFRTWVTHKPSIQTYSHNKIRLPPKHSLHQLLLSVSESASLPLEWFLCRSLWECLDFFFSFFFFCFLCLDFFCKKQQQTNGEYRWSHSWTFVCLCVCFFLLFNIREQIFLFSETLHCDSCPSKMQRI